MQQTSWTLATHSSLPNVNATTKPIYETVIRLPDVEFIDHGFGAGGNEVLMAQQIFVRRLLNIPGGLAGAYCTVLAWYVPANAPILSSSGKEFVIDGNMPNAEGHMFSRFAYWFARVQNENFPDNLLDYVRGALGLLTTEGGGSTMTKVKTSSTFGPPVAV